MKRVLTHLIKKICLNSITRTAICNIRDKFTIGFDSSLFNRVILVDLQKAFGNYDSKLAVDFSEDKKSTFIFSGEF